MSSWPVAPFFICEAQFQKEKQIIADKKASLSALASPRQSSNAKPAAISL